jgi:ubiquinone/menaquinone biosynthesis C-methylase UbiE
VNEAQPPVIITRLSDSVYSPFAMLAGMQLDLFTPLEDGPFTAEELADTLDVQVTKLRPLLYALVVAGLLNVEDGLFANTPETDEYLVRGRPSYLGGEHELMSVLWEGLLKTAATISAGTPQAKVDYFSMSDEELAAVFRGLHPGAIAVGHNLMAQHDFSTFRSLLDVGGGSGGLAIALTESNPQLRATVVDLALVTPLTERFVEEANAVDRVEIVTADVVRDGLSGSFDVAVVSKLTQVLSPDEVRAALANVANVLDPGGVIHLVTQVLDDSRLSPEEAVSFNLVFLNIYDQGQAYTEQEYRDWLAESGFVDFERVPLPSNPKNSIVTARKPTA